MPAKRGWFRSTVVRLLVGVELWLAFQIVAPMVHAYLGG